MAQNRWWDYVSAAMGDMSALEAGRKAGFDSSAFTRWKKGASPDAAFVVKFARAFDLNVVAALAAAGVITDDEAGVREVAVGARDAVRRASSDTLLDEVGRRVRVGEAAEQAGRVIEGRFRQMGSGRDFSDLAVAQHSEVSIFDEQDQSGETP